MKKFLTVLLCVATVIACALPMAGCSLFVEKPETDLETAKENLITAGYTIETYYELNSISEIAEKRGIADYLEASKDYGDDEYEVVIMRFGNSNLAIAYYKELKATRNAAIDYANAEIDYYEEFLDDYSSAISSERKENIQEKLSDYKDEVEEYNDLILGRSGEYVWYGQKEAIKATKGE